ncbi:HNH endonuclease signature motif containing protein [Notoacmeibacter sp. MSK16QG-6]|uniref:HNH endonuclease signature motif containing protein n=1 Tax=Notoacmeibacter sp. MSK16QG-6 TaxID=2957982 RepID=UPI0020A17AE5|nr:HNH endonuclease signature motif containing protein [Notoacmeibacter sp. MSK16QG-6]MCP1200066.1 HNH endonuclease [Notoacmeibacter sp. MSK16QG-6]
MAKLHQPPARIGAVPARLTAPPKVAEPFYLSPEWRRLIAEIKRERGNRCEDCGARGSKNIRIIGDHVDEISDGGARLDRRNIRLLCTPCHGRKTARAKRERSRGQR